MCVNFTPSRKDQLNTAFSVQPPASCVWKNEVWQDDAAPVIIADASAGRACISASYGMLPKHQFAPGSKRYSTMNARAETIASLKSYRSAWQHGQRCVVPMQNFFEPNYESGKAQRWHIGVRDQDDFVVAGLFQAWESVDKLLSYSFTQITINADQHPLMKRFHPPGEEKRSLVILPAENIDAWLHCRDLEQARNMLQLYPADKMWGQPVDTKPPAQASLF
ncbi:SOS response-associated peptidase [Undibacterium crateris]|uniref:SOS response-associated peptidase n=1 Tax=Undibacterium crateris TaxID=2528175 RepID=UPI001389AFB5|nr:SOS response-associated peptidase family protein [Undibacterium crateris]NDI86819.1 DUF159 family protein [Undibacterium crateris]